MSLSRCHSGILIPLSSKRRLIATTFHSNFHSRTFSRAFAWPPRPKNRLGVECLSYSVSLWEGERELLEHFLANGEARGIDRPPRPSTGRKSRAGKRLSRFAIPACLGEGSTHTRRRTGTTSSPRGSRPSRLRGFIPLNDRKWQPHPPSLPRPSSPLSVSQTSFVPRHWRVERVRKGNDWFLVGKS